MKVYIYSLQSSTKQFLRQNLHISKATVFSKEELMQKYCINYMHEDEKNVLTMQ